MSITEMLKHINASGVDEIRHDDHVRDKRMAYLSENIGLSFRPPVKFEAKDVHDRTAEWENYFKDHKDSLCAFRVVPKPDESVKKIRLRGKSVAQTLDWFDKQDIEHEKYHLFVMPHFERKAWSTIFVSSKSGIHGEIIYGNHTQLTQGHHVGEPPIVFKYDFESWTLSRPNDDALEYLKELIEYIHVSDKIIQNKLAKDLEAEFKNGYLLGYFESFQEEDEGNTHFIDFNKHLGLKLENLGLSQHTDDQDSLVTGQAGCKGKVAGVVKVVESIDDVFKDGEILVTRITSPDFLPLMQKAAAIVTDEGGILSHSAIVARELGVPCVVGTQGATKNLKTGQKVVVDADQGVVRAA
ncbi:MAG: PEP-utilizing enzyme [Candidatus Saccharimonadales bacterium]|nr:PEP-utilizing enzyme [Candidatus Saccharimonadales bacterium]